MPSMPAGSRSSTCGAISCPNRWPPHPLALCDALSVEPEDLVVFEIHYADRIGENYFAKHASGHNWYFYPELTRDEALLIKQWDSQGEFARSNGGDGDGNGGGGPCTFSFHSAFDDPRHAGGRRRTAGASRFAASPSIVDSGGTVPCSLLTACVIMISGANRGIGHAIAEALHDAGYTLSLGARDPASLDQTTKGWDAERVLINRYDAEDQASHHQWVAATVDRFGRIDGLVNNAGMAVRVTVEDYKDEALDRMWAVNVKAPLSMIRTALPHLRRSGSGRIINVSSIAGKAVYNNNAGYAMTKFAAVALSHATRHTAGTTACAARRWCPGFVATDMTADVETFPHDQMMEPGDIAEIVLTLVALSNNASVAELVVNCRNDVTPRPDRVGRAGTLRAGSKRSLPILGWASSITLNFRSAAGLFELPQAPLLRATTDSRAPRAWWNVPAHILTSTIRAQ